MQHIQILESRIQFNGGGGAVDPTFGTAGTATVDLSAAVGDNFTTLPFEGERNFTQDSRGRIYVISEADREVDLASRVVIARLTRDGALDTTFAAGGYRVVGRSNTFTTPPRAFVDPHNRTYVLDGNVLSRLSPAGKIDRSFGRKGKIFVPILLGASVSDISFDANGLAYVAGSAQGKSGTRMAVLRLTESGARDTSWSIQGVYESPVHSLSGSTDNQASALFLRFSPNGQLGVVGTFAFTKDQHENTGVWSTRLNPDGKVDTSYGINGYAEKLYTNSDVVFGNANPLELARDGSVIGVVTEASDVDTSKVGFNFRISADGKRVSDLHIYAQPTDGSVVDPVQSPVVTQPDGKILAPGGNELNLLRSNGDGTLDSSWGDMGQSADNTLTTSESFDLAADGSVIVLASGADSHQAYVRRLFRDDAPLGQFDGHVITQPRSTAVRFSVIWRDDDGVNPSSIDSNDLRVTGPFDGQRRSRAAVLDLVESLGDGRYRATYHITSPGGWSAIDNGSYTVKLLHGQVEDINGLAAPAGPMGTFRVQIA